MAHEASLPQSCTVESNYILSTADGFLMFCKKLGPSSLKKTALLRVTAVCGGNDVCVCTHVNMNHSMLIVF